MSNPHDDPARRPPPPRQGEPTGPYQGAPPPPYQGDPHAYQGDPHAYQGGPYAHQAPPRQPTGAWQAPPDYGAPQLASEAGYTRQKSGLGSLFDLKFDRMVTPWLIRIFYLLAVMFVTMTAVVSLVIGFWLYQYGYLLTVFTVLFTPPLWLLSMLVIRIFLEFIINQFKVTEYLKDIREEMKATGERER